MFKKENVWLLLVIFFLLAGRDVRRETIDMTTPRRGPFHKRHTESFENHLGKIAEEFKSPPVYGYLTSFICLTPSHSYILTRYNQLSLLLRLGERKNVTKRSSKESSILSIPGLLLQTVVMKRPLTINEWYRYHSRRMSKRWQWRR